LGGNELVERCGTTSVLTSEALACARDLHHQFARASRRINLDGCRESSVDDDLLACSLRDASIGILVQDLLKSIDGALRVALLDALDRLSPQALRASLRSSPHRRRD